jgi:phosphoadenosine phosphosulfate reductase
VEEAMKVLALSGGKDSMACLYLMRDELDAAIYVDTGYSYPETHAMIAHAETLIPVYTVNIDREANIQQHGLPSDVVPVEWTAMGQALTSRKPITIQASFLCCYQNIAVPLTEEAKRLGATHIVTGQRNDESHRSTSKHGDTVDGLIRWYPIADWTGERVLAYLATKMDVPEHFHFQQSSLDCYDCTAYRQASEDRLAWTKARYPAYFRAYDQKYSAVLQAIQAAI